MFPMMKGINMNIEVPEEFVQKIIVEELKWHYYHTKPNDKPPVFSYDEKVDQREVKKLRKALKRVLEYYGCIVES